MKKIYIADLDGTLLLGQAKLSEYAAGILNRYIGSGGIFCPATSRDEKGALRILSEVRLNAPAILLNGALVLDTATGQYLKKELISSEDTDAVVAAAHKNNVLPLLTCQQGDIAIQYYEEGGNDPYKRYVEFGKKRDPQGFAEGYGLPSNAEPLCIKFWEEHADLAPLFEELAEMHSVSCAFYEDVYNKGLWFLEVSSISATKKQAALYVKELYNADMLIGFGDSHNDEPLLEACDEFYAVENANEALKQKATQVIGPNTEDSVAAFIAQLEGF
ncbi:MAG: HAD family hydrolase [Eubacteriaceae bacterium]|nr:HAD family hydrolase [Eubacteriaceae bacterium]